ncbi:MAG TPA: hypothetical protein VMX17_09015 [Candidatus Glassbacteria bacterium]|nr:hypothetical protein [Candidatus Glassbacteria bacterium]
MSSIISYIEQLCKSKNLELPALIQLRAAKDKNDLESVQRISKNILEYIDAKKESKNLK